MIGFFPWAFVDTFEWNSSYGHRYGMHYIDYASQKRIPRNSAKWYADWLNQAAPTSLARSPMTLASGAPGRFRSRPLTRSALL